MLLKHVRELYLSLNIYTFSTISSLTCCRDVSQIFIGRYSEILYTHEQICFENAYLRRIQQETDESHLSLNTASDRQKCISCALDRILHKYPSNYHIHIMGHELFTYKGISSKHLGDITQIIHITENTRILSESILEINFPSFHKQTRSSRIN